MLITNKILNNFIGLFDEKVPPSKNEKIKVAKNIISGYSIPERYLTDLNKDERFLRQIELISKKRQTKSERLKPLSTDKIARKKGIPKRGTCTQRWGDMHPNAKTNAEKAKITGIPKSILDKVENKGRGAFYSSGSRPGQTAISWGVARVNCFILHKESVTKGPDKDLYQQAITQSKKAKMWFEQTQYTE